MECLLSVKAIKYIYKYVYKGHDYTTMEFWTCLDEIKLYLDSRYVSACEGIWRLLGFDMHEEFPNIVHLQVYLPQQQTVTWNAEIAGNLQEVVDQQGERDIKLTAYLKPMQIYLFHMYETSSIKTSLPDLYGWTSNANGKQEPRGLPLVTCYMSMQIQEITSIFMYFSQQSKVLRHLRIFIL